MNSSCGVRPSCATSVCRFDQQLARFTMAHRISWRSVPITAGSARHLPGLSGVMGAVAYKDIGLQGSVFAAADSPYMVLLKDFLAKKERLGADSWGGTDGHIRAVVDPLESLLAREFPDFNPYPWGAQKWAARLAASHPYLRGTDTGIRRAVSRNYPH